MLILETLCYVSGNFRLRTWAATSLRKAGLCGDHFDEKCFTNATKKALRRNVVPRHYTEDLKYRETNNVNMEQNNENTKENTASEEDDDPMNCNRLSPFGESASQEKKSDLEIHDESSLQSGEYIVGDPLKTSTGDRSPSPVVEFIVEELDESLICDQAEEDDEKLIFKEEIENDDSQNHDAYATSPMSMVESNEDIEPASEDTGLRVNRSSSDVRTYYRSKNHRTANGDEVARIKLEIASEDSEPVTDEDVSAKSIITSVNTTCGNRRHKDAEKKMLINLQEENKLLRKNIRLLKQNLRRSKAREAHYMKVRDMLKDVNEFLNIQVCKNPVARAMVKLALHKNRSPYTMEEKDFATQLYRHSPTAFIQLRRAGCNFPGKNTIKRWIAENDGQPSTCNFLTAKGNDDAAEDEAIDMDDADDDVLETVETANEPVDNNDEVDGDAEVAVDDYVEHLEEVIDETEEHQEYMEVLPLNFK